MLDAALKLGKDVITVLADIINWIWSTLWKLNRGAARSLLPGQPRGVQSMVAFIAVCLEIVGLWVALVAWAAG